MKNLLSIWKHKGQILEGIRNNVFKNEDIEEVAAYRKGVCAQCPFLDEAGSECAMPGTQPCCADCGCSLQLKLRAMSSSCPRGYWLAMMTDLEESALHHTLNQTQAP
jgi:hypothetical protein